MSSFDAPLPAPDLVPPTGGPEEAARIKEDARRGVAPDHLSVPFTGDADIPLDDAPAYAEQPDIAPMESILDILREEFVPVEKTYAVPTRPKLALTFRTDISQAHMDEFRKRAQVGRRSLRPGSEPDVDGAKFAALMIGQYCTGLNKVDSNGQGVPVLRSHLDSTAPDERVHFGHRELLQQLGAKNRAEGVRKLFGQDGPMLAMSNQLLNDSGLMDEMNEATVAAPTDGQ